MSSEGSQHVRGRMWFRNCYTGCPAYTAHEKLGASPDLLAKACKACTLIKEPMPEAVTVMEYAMMPDAAIDYNALPYWLVKSIGVYRFSKRGGF